MTKNKKFAKYIFFSIHHFLYILTYLSKKSQFSVEGQITDKTFSTNSKQEQFKWTASIWTALNLIITQFYNAWKPWLIWQSVNQSRLKVNRTLYRCESDPIPLWIRPYTVVNRTLYRCESDPTLLWIGPYTVVNRTLYCCESDSNNTN